MTSKAQEAQLMQGDVVGSYRLLTELGAGGMGSVWLAEHLRLGKKRYALKILLPECAANPDIRSRFEREAEAVGTLDHPNVVSASDFGYTDDGRPFLVMEALTGKSLRRLLDDQRGIPLDIEYAVNLMRQACAGVTHAHDHGIIHRDLKPANLFVAQDKSGRDPGQSFGLWRCEDLRDYERPWPEDFYW